MAKEQKKKRKLNIVRVLIFLLIVIFISCLVYFVLNKKINNIYIIDNNYIKDIDIIRDTKLDNYPSLILTDSNKIKKTLLKNPIISDVSVSKNFIDFSITIKIEENIPLFYDQLYSKTVLKNEEKIDDDNLYSLPILINNIPTDTYSNLVKKFINIDQSIREKISEIKYNPNDVDDERFLLTMKDGNYVYVTLTKIKNINNYSSILPSLENKKGILYLDSGQYFEAL